MECKLLTAAAFRELEAAFDFIHRVRNELHYHCGKATDQLTLVECAADGRNSQKALCDPKKIEGFPTWEINGRLDSGVKSLAELARLSGYTGPLR